MVKFLKLATVFFICSNMSAAQPKLIGSLELTSFMGLVQNLSPLAEKIYPGSSVKLVFGLTALTLNPEFNGLDFTSPISARLYAFGEKENPSLEWMLVFKKKGKDLPEKINIAGENAIVKGIGEMAAVGKSKKFLDSFSSLSIPENSDGSDFKLKINVAEYMRLFRKDFFAFRKSAVKFLAPDRLETKEGMESYKEAQVKLDYLEKVLAQISDLDLGISIKPGGISIDNKIKAEKDSALEKFVIQQKNCHKKLPPLLEDKLVAGSSSIALTKPLRESIVSLVEEIAAEKCEDEEKLKYLEPLSALIKNMSGEASYFADINKSGLPYSCLQIDIESALKKNVERSLAAFPATNIGAQKIYKLSSDKISDTAFSNFLCVPNKSGMALLNGPISEKEAMTILKAKGGAADKFKDCSLVMQYEGGSKPTSLQLKFKDNSALLLVCVSAEMLRSFIPKRHLGESAPSNGKKQRIRINPSDLFLRMKK